MTLKQWIDKVEFDDIVTHLLNIESPVRDNLVDYRMAFDRLRRTEPLVDDGTAINVEMTDYEDGNPPILSMHCCHDSEWNQMLGRNVTVSDDVMASDEEIVAVMLWELTYWGFGDDEPCYQFRFGQGDYGCYLEENPFIAAHRQLNQRNHDLNCRYKDDIGKMRFTHDIFWEPRRNGPKRHRERRQSIRLKQLENKMRKWDLWKRFTLNHNVTNLDWSTFDKKGTIYREIMESICDIGQEIDYFRNLWKYVSLKETIYDCIMVGIRYTYGIESKELETLLQVSLPQSNISFYLVEDKYIQNTKIEILLFKRLTSKSKRYANND